MGVLGVYGADKTNFAEVAGPGHFNDPDMVSARDEGRFNSILLYAGLGLTRRPVSIYRIPCSQCNLRP